MLPLALLHHLLLLLAIFDSGALARRGGGDHDSDSSSGSGGSSSESDGSDGNNVSSGPSGCGSETPSNQLSTTYLVPSHAQNWTSQAGAMSTMASPDIYDGSYFQGEGLISYDMVKGSECHNSKELRVLGYAWIGPPPPNPQGSENPFMIGFKAWESSKDVSEIHTSYSQIKWEGDMCASPPDLFRIATTRGSTSRGKASDTMTLNVSEGSDTIDFNGTTVKDLSPRISGYQGLFRLRAGGCLAHDTDMHWPDTTAMQGSITNTTMKLKFTGAVDMNSTQYQFYKGREEDLKVNFTVTFSGQFDSVNSTHAVHVQQGNQSLAWVPTNAAGIVSGGWPYTLGCTAGVQIMLWWLW